MAYYANRPSFQQLPTINKHTMSTSAFSLIITQQNTSNKPSDHSHWNKNFKKYMSNIIIYSYKSIHLSAIHATRTNGSWCHGGRRITGPSRVRHLVAEFAQLSRHGFAQDVLATRSRLAQLHEGGAQSLERSHGMAWHGMASLAFEGFNSWR